jgi:hypothetical protein
MLFPGIRKIGKELGLKRTSDAAVGMVSNTYVTLYDASNLKVADLRFPYIDSDFVTETEALLHEGGHKRFVWIDQTLRLEFQEIFKPFPVRKIKDLVVRLAKVNEGRFPGERSKCSLCGQSPDVETYFSGNDTYILCESCSIKTDGEIRKTGGEFRAAPGHYLRGAFSGLAAALPGILVTTAFFIFLNHLAAVSAMIYVALGAWGYKKAGGKTDGIGAIILGVLTIVMIAVGIVISYVFNLWYLAKSIGTALQALGESRVQNELLLNIFVGLIVSSFYLAFQFWEMAKTWKVPLLRKAYAIK